MPERQVKIFTWKEYDKSEVERLVNHMHAESCWKGIYGEILQRQSTEREENMVENSYFLNL